MPYYNTAYRIRKWGRLPFRRGATLVVANHQHDFDSTVVVMWLNFDGPWRDPIYSAAGRRMFEPGFMTPRAAPLLAPLLRRWDPTPLFRALGLNPIENMLYARPISSIAWSVRQRHGDLPLAAVFEDAVLDRAGLHGARLSDLLDAKWFGVGLLPARIGEVLEPFRSEILARAREDVRADVARMEHLLRRDATLFLTAEGRYSVDGRMGRFREAFRRLAPLANVYLAPISYDVFRGPPFSMLFRIVGPVARDSAPDALAAARPVTVSQLMAEWLSSGPARVGADEAAAAIAARVAGLPAALFVDPELRREPSRVVRSALATMARLGVLQAEGDDYRLTDRRSHPQFPAVRDMLAFQRRFLEETLRRTVGCEEI